ncbi:MAG: hypothetical protein MJY76_01365 [Bacteroidales bacterium]|nr:hypothetical protein [Bacteroidales bacterium]
MAKTPVTFTASDIADREVLKLDYEFDQAKDIQGQLTGIPRGGYINIRVKALNDGNPDILNWMVDPRLLKSGKISFNNTVDGKKMKDIEFTDAYCVKYNSNEIENEGDFEDFTIICRVIKVGNVQYENDWA